MDQSHHDLEIEAGAFRIDVWGEHITIPDDQAPADEIECQLKDLMQPENAGRRAQAVTAAQHGASAIDAVMLQLRTKAVAAQARLRRTRRRVNTAPEAAEVPALTESSLMFSSRKWAEEAMPGIVRAGLGVVFSSLCRGRSIGVESTGDVVNGVMTFEIGAGSSSCSVLGVAACLAADIDEPYSSGVINILLEAMNSHAWSNPDIRYAWAIMLGPGCVRVCLIEPDAIHLSAVHNTDTPAGRLLLGAAVVHAAMSEPWRLGADPTMRWRDDIERWVIECPGADDGEPAETFYAPGELEFIAKRFFGRFTRCFAVARTPDDTDFRFILKDSWQLVATDLEDPELRDEISVMRDIQEALVKVECEGGVLQRLVCGGTVRIKNTRDSSQLVLGPVLDTYERWAMIPGSKRPTSTLRLHRRMVSGPIGVPLYEICNDRDAAATVAGAMSVHDTIMREAGILHRDISLGNVLGVRQADGSIRGMLIDFDHSVTLDDERNQEKPGCVGTKPFMSIANLEGIDVPRTSVDDWEAALALLMYWAARPSRRNRLRARLGRVGPSGLADFRRNAFASRESLDATIVAYLDLTCGHTLKLIRDLHQALFGHLGCPGTARIMLRGNRLMDQIIRRVDYADDIHERCLKVVTEYLSEHLSEYETEYQPEFLTEVLAECLANSENKTAPTLMASPRLRSPSISSAIDNRSAATGQRPSETPVEPAPCPLPTHPLLPVTPSPTIYEQEGSLRNKRKAESSEASPRVKRANTMHNNVGFAPANSSLHPPAPSDPEVNSPTIIGDARSPASYTTPSSDSSDDSHISISSDSYSDSSNNSHISISSDSSGDAPAASHATATSAVVSVSKLKRREVSRDKPPAAPLPKRRKFR